MRFLLPIFVIAPAFGFLVSLIINRKRERLLSMLAYSVAGFTFLFTVIFSIFWLFIGSPDLTVREIPIFKSGDYEFFLDFFFDRISATYLFVGAFLTFLITIYSRYYLHRESGYKRFFNTILFFYLGYNLTVISGNFETLFIGWEFLGISSFLLIAFYRNRYLPVKNAFKVFSVYRIADVGILLAMWLSHHLFHENITFYSLQNQDLVSEHLTLHSYVGTVLALLILLSATAKSAQFPFSPWLPRAMEGPTPSSAIFYSSLAVHIGVFILLRTYPIWENQIGIRFLIGGVGLLTSLLASPTARVQASIKAQVAYSSIAQIGLIFIEIAAGFEVLALIHFAGNAFLRTYQLLVSPSVVTYLIREQFYHFKPREQTIEDSLPKRIERTIYVFSLKEWNLDTLLYKVLWKPIKDLGGMLTFVSIKGLLRFFIPLYIVGVLMMYYQQFVPSFVKSMLPPLFSFFALMMVLRAFDERYGARLSIILVALSHAWIALAVSFNDQFDFSHIIIYLSGISIAAIVAILALNRIKHLEKHVNLTRFQGHIYEHPKIGTVFLLACLGLAGFPITTSFIGEDLIFTHIREDQFVLVLFTASTFMMDALAVIRIYTRVFLGPHIKGYHETAQTSA